jgi:hypothetical protein
VVVEGDQGERVRHLLVDVDLCFTPAAVAALPKRRVSSSSASPAGNHQQPGQSGQIAEVVHDQNRAPGVAGEPVGDEVHQRG